MIPPLWLSERISDTPEPLREKLQAAIGELDPEGEPTRELLRAAIRRLESVQNRLHQREAAFDLLVADGLLTLACEAAAFGHPERVGELCREMGPGGELGRLAARWLGES
jgi:hypothetical protein